MSFKCGINETVLHKCHTFRSVYGRNKALTTIREIFGQLFFSVIKKFGVVEWSKRLF